MAIEASEEYMANRQDWCNWLLNNAASSKGIWLVYDKGDKRTLSPADITEEALCFGWFDSVPGKISETQSKIYVCSRKPKSVWPTINLEWIYAAKTDITKQEHMKETVELALKGIKTQPLPSITSMEIVCG